MSETCDCPICLHPDAFDDIVKRHARYHSAFWENPAAWGPKLHAMGGLPLPDLWPEARNPKPQPPAPVKPAVIPSLPPLSRQVQSFVESAVKVIGSGFARASDEEVQRRWSICESCTEHFRPSDKRCGAMTGCGCYLAQKIVWEASFCPVGKWLAVDPNTTIPPCSDCGSPS